MLILAISLTIIGAAVMLWGRVLINRMEKKPDVEFLAGLMGIGVVVGATMVSILLLILAGCAWLATLIQWLLLRA